MKKVVLLIEFGLLFLCSITMVYAKDTVYSLNKNKDERFNFVLNSYSNKGSIDGLIVGGNYQNSREDTKEESDDYQIMIVKYSKTGNVKWKYTYGKSTKDVLDCLAYSYDNEGIIDGYILVLDKTYNEDENIVNTTTFIKIDLDGKLIFEKDSNLNKEEHIEKIIPINDNKGYIGIGYNKVKNIALLINYDKELNVLWSREKSSEAGLIIYSDITIIQDNGQIQGYVVIEEKTIDNNTSKNLIRYDTNGNEIKTISSDIDKYDSTYLDKTNNGFILYGMTSLVKLAKGKESYYLINFNNNDEIVWEVVGDIPIDKDKKMKLMPQYKDNEINGYLLLYSNSSDDSYEVVSLDEEGLLEKKIKKINNNYYDIEDFLVTNNTIYLVGQIDCPEDDSCDYDKNSLLLISDEDKVIEVEDKASTNILVIIGGLFCVMVVGILIHKKTKKKTTIN